MTKTLDQLLFLYYNKNDQVRITDLHQGIVWGTNTDATDRDPRLTNRRLRRRLRHRPEPLLDAGGHRLPPDRARHGRSNRAFIHIRDSVKCVQLALENPHQGRAGQDL